MMTGGSEEIVTKPGAKINEQSRECAEKAFKLGHCFQYTDGEFKDRQNVTRERRNMIEDNQANSVIEGERV